MPLTGEQLAGKHAEFDFPWNGDVVHLEYRTEAITREFRAELMRLGRHALRVERHQREQMQIVSTVNAVFGSPEAEAEERAAEAAIKSLLMTEDEIKDRLDGLVLSVVERWDIAISAADSRMLPLDAEHLHPLPALFLSSILQACEEHALLGEATSPNSSTNSPLPLRPKARQEIGRQSRNSTISSKRRVGARR